MPIADSLTRARENAEETHGADAICEGLRLTEKEFYETLKELRIEPIKALGEPFDPEYHDAVYQQPTSEAEPNTVIGELKIGFLIDGQLLRPSQVVVAAPEQHNKADSKKSHPENDNASE